MLKSIKANQWWGYHYMVMLGSAYYVIYITPVLPSVWLVLAKLAIFTLATVGIASFGYVINDLLDMKQDLRSGHYNIMAKQTRLGRILILVLVLLLGIIPWFWLPRTPLILTLLVSEYALFLAYSVPPVRLKARGLLGPIADSIYAYVLPGSIAALVASDGSQSPEFALYISIFILWSFLFGVVGILRHQLFDHSRDKLDNINTFAIGGGWNVAYAVTLWLAKASFFAYLILIALQGHAGPFILVGFGAHLLRQLWNWNRQLIVSTQFRDPVARPDRFQLLYSLIIGEFCWYWQPLIVLILLAARSSDYLFLLMVHLILLPNGIKRMLPRGR